jgi:hypothetical protein
MYLVWFQHVVRAATEAERQPTDDRITMMLTAVAVGVAAATLALAALAVFLAYITFVGKREIIQKAEAAAKKAAEEYLERDEGLQELNEPAVEPEPEELAAAVEDDDGANELE